MNISRINLYKYTLKLNNPVLIRGHSLNCRNGFIIELRGGGDIEGFGEVAPLPGFSNESLSEAGDQLVTLKTQLEGQEIPANLTKFDGHFERWLKPFDLKPSVRFGLESAVLHLMANAQNKPLYKLIPDSTGHDIRIAGLLTGTNGNLAAQARDLISEGFSEIKLKVGGEVEEDIARVREVNNVAYGKVLLHVDANQQWNYDQALAFGKEIGCAAISYIEEPFKEIGRIPEFFQETLIPVALDESLRDLDIEDIRHISGVETLVLKPMMLGGIEKTIQLMTQAENFAIDTVISSSFESSLGIWTLANIAEAATHNNAAGLDTMKWLKEDIFNESIHFRNGTINPGRHSVRAKDINFALLQKWL